jgi:SAM-dependent methyltransferase
MLFQRHIASQLRQPSGWFGSIVVSRLMNRVNRKIIDSTIALLELRPQHRVLEIGFGGGSALVRLVRTLSGGQVSGIDPSSDLVRQAERRFRREIAQGRVQIQLGNVSGLPFPDAIFDRVFTINTIYFWSDALQGLVEIRRVLKDSGRAAISIRSREHMEKVALTNYDFRLFSPEEVADLMRQAGFRDVRIDHRDRGKLYDQAIIFGTR